MKDLLIEQIQIKVSEYLDRASDEILKELKIRVDDYHGRASISHVATELIAQRWVNENYDKIAEKINLERVVKMAEYRAVGKTFGER